MSAGDWTETQYSMAAVNPTGDWISISGGVVGVIPKSTRGVSCRGTRIAIRSAVRVATCRGGSGRPTKGAVE